MLGRIVSYFRDCYEADNRQTPLWNIFASGVEHRIFAEDEEELLTGVFPYLPIDPEAGQAAKAAAHMYRKEKDLLYCSLFVVGSIRNPDESLRRLCSPLLMHRATILEKDGNVFIEADLDARRLNYRLLHALHPDDSDEPLADEVARVIGQEHLSYDAVADVAVLLDQAIPMLDTIDLYGYPNLTSGKELKKAFDRSKRASEPHAKIVPASMTVLVKRSVETRGVLSELKSIADGTVFSEPLTVLLADDEPPSKRHRAAIHRVPAVLSHAQEEVLQRASTQPLTLVIGPPGTGKSYTIAALAMEHLARGQSVLIASKMNHAVDVVGTKVEEQLNIRGCVVRGGRKQYLRELKNYVQQLLGGMHSSSDTRTPAFTILKELARLDRSIRKLEATMDRRGRQELRWGARLADAATGFIGSAARRYVRRRATTRRPMWQLLDDLERLLERRIRRTTALVQSLNGQRIEQALNRDRQQFSVFLKAIRARTGGKQEDLFREVDFKALLKAFPVWLVNLAEIYDVLPLRSELFDLAIIDEASQCDVAGCIPILQRAKRAVIIGDPNQLRHVSFLSRGRQRALLEEHGLPVDQAERLSFRDKSILDVANEKITDQSHVVFLNEHFRSVPSIIDFSNGEFYGGSLRIMTQKPDEKTDPPLQLRLGVGERVKSGENRAEARRLVEDVKRQVDQEEALDRDSCHSIGILSPFRAQADLLSQLIGQEMPISVLSKHRILVGTAYSFQGEERDIMYLSFAVDSSSHPASLRFLEKPDVFNVAITRARVAQYVYLSIGQESVSRDTLLGRYWSYIDTLDSTPGDPTRRGPHHDVFLTEVDDELLRSGLKTWSAYPIAGMTMDLVVAGEQGTCGIDLIGYPGEFEAVFSLERYKMFRRAGLRVFPLPFSKWRVDPEMCIAEVRRIVGSSVRNP